MKTYGFLACSLWNKHMNSSVPDCAYEQLLNPQRSMWFNEISLYALLLAQLLILAHKIWFAESCIIINNIY